MSTPERVPGVPNQSVAEKSHWSAQVPNPRVTPESLWSAQAQSIAYPLLCKVVLHIGASSLTTRSCSAHWRVFALLTACCLHLLACFAYWCVSLTIVLVLPLVRLRLLDLYAVVLLSGASSLSMCSFRSYSFTVRGCPAYWCVLPLLTDVSSLTARLFSLLARLRTIRACFAYWHVFAYYVRLFCPAARLRLLYDPICNRFAYRCVFAYHARLFPPLV